MICDLIGASFDGLQCENTAEGARIVTHCLHPSFDPVAVYVQRHLDGFLVHDGGEAFDLAWLENRNAKALTRLMHECAMRFGVECDDHRIFGRALNQDWLPNVIMAVANAAAAATGALLHSDLGLSDVEDSDLREQTYAILKEAFTDKRVPRRVDRRGRTGKKFKFAFGVQLGAQTALVDTVVPNPISVSSRYTAFAAVSARSLGGAFITHNVALAPEDSGLLAEVADVVPLASLAAHIEQELSARSMRSQ